MTMTRDIIRIGDKMSYQSLYRKYRPTDFSNMVGQEAVVKIIKNAIKKDKIGHAYLFCGPRGTGKTSMAKLLAQAVNCTNMEEDVCNHCENCLEQQQGNHPDIVEIDAASNNGVDEIRNLISRVKYTPIMGKYKVYIIDEVHMLSQGAFNALLKTLEEPPSHVIFVLATTEVHKVIPTIVSRCQRFDFKRISDDLIAQRLNHILKEEELDHEEGLGHVIARLSGGGLRNALTILEQAIVYSDNKVLISDVYEVAGIVSNEDKIELMENIKNNNIEKSLNKTNDLLNRSQSTEQLMSDFILALKDSVIYKETKNVKLVAYEHLSFTQYLSENFSEKDLFKILKIFLDYSDKMKFSHKQAIYFELSIINILKQVNRKNHDNKIYKEKKVLEEENIAGYEDINSDFNTEDIENSTVSRETKRFKLDDKPDKKTVEIKKEHLEEESQELINQEMIISLMVSADKEQRFKDEEKLEFMQTYKHDLTWAKSVRLLENAELVLSSPHFIVYAFPNETAAREAMVKQNNLEIIKLLEELTQIRRKVFATTKSKFKEGIGEFVRLSKENQLPNKLDEIHFALEEENEISIDPRLEKAKTLFGEKLEVKE